MLILCITRSQNRNMEGRKLLAAAAALAQTEPYGEVVVSGLWLVHITQLFEQSALLLLTCFSAPERNSIFDRSLWY